METRKRLAQFPAVIDSLSPIRDFITEAVKAVGLDKKQTYNLCLAVDEIAANVIMYGHERSQLQGVIDFEIECGEKQIFVNMYDDSAPFDPFQHQLPTDDDLSAPLEDRPIGGLGVFLAINGVDEFIYKRENGRNLHIFVVNV
jgi:serine/threonine-protein kinase RsbW